MFNTPLGTRFFVLLLVFLITTFSITRDFIFGSQKASVFGFSDDKYLTVSFLDVGQGDAIFIETPEGVQLLIDGGPDESVLRELSRRMSVLDRGINIVLATHSDKDHIGGLVDVLKRYSVDTIIQTSNKNDTAVAATFNEKVGLENTEVLVAGSGQQYQLGASTTLLILSPEGDPTEWESNTASIVAQLQYGDIEFLLTGDAPINIEEYIAKSYGRLLESEVLKLGHHGSDTSTADLFLDKVQPKYAIVSSGLNNSYGHPHKEVMGRLETRAIEVLNTATEGTIVFKSDGKRVWRE